MEAREIHSFAELHSAKFGLLEPADSAICVLPQAIDFALVPCLSCTVAGVRIGYGGGYYDRYLAGSRFPAAVLCRARLMSQELPQQKMDRCIPIIISEEMVWRTGT
jgi:5-formyltetrahydrofolate cyclo-ligase